MDTIEVSLPTFRQVMHYLAQKPYGEVASLIGALKQDIENAEKKKAEELDKEE